MSGARRQHGKLQWTGEHWIAMLRSPGAARESAIVSHYLLRRSPVGEGNVAVVRIGDEQGFHAVCYDNAAIVPWALDRLYGGAGYLDPVLAHLPCAFIRGGDTARDPSWRIQTEDGRLIDTCWQIREEPVVINTPWKDNRYVFSILHFTWEATVAVNGRRIEGKPYSRDVWRDSIGGDRSSCVFALSESFFELHENDR